MADRLGDHFSCISLPEFLSLGWFLCFAIFGFAYYTNPSEISLKSFLHKFPISVQSSLPKIDNHASRGHHSINRSRSKNQHQQSPGKPSHRNLKNSSHSLSPSSQASFQPLSTFPYSRHNLLLCTLVSVDPTQHLALDISFDHPDDDNYPQLEWFLGCFDTWFALRRPIPPAIASFPTFSVRQTLRTIWKQWTWPIPDLLLPPTLTTSSSLQDLSPLIKPKKKKSPRSQKLHSLQCQTSDLCDHSVECSTPEHSFTSHNSSHESDCYSTQQLSPNCESPPLVPLLNPSVSLPTQSGKSDPVRSTCTAPTTPNPVWPISVTQQASESIGLPHDVACGSLTRSDLVSSVNCSTDRNSLPPSPRKPRPSRHSYAEIQPKSSAPSECSQRLPENNPRSLPEDRERKLKLEAKHDPPVKLITPVTQKPLNEAKTLKNVKQSNFNEKQDPSKPIPAPTSKQLVKSKAEVSVSHGKSGSIQVKCKKDPQQTLKKEDDKVKSSTRASKAEGGKLPKAKDIKSVGKSDSKEKLVTRQPEANKKREVNPKQVKPNTNPIVVRKVDRQSPIIDDEVNQPALVPHHSFGCSKTPSPPDHPAIIPINLLHSIPKDSIPLIPQAHNMMMPSQLESFNSSLLLHDVSPQYPLSDPWAPDPWSEAIQQSHIRDSFINLPNLERSALKDHFPILRGLDYASPLHTISPSTLSEEVYNYQQELNLPTHITNTPEWTFLPPIQTSPFGAIGQQGSGIPTPAHSSPVLSSSLFSFPGPQVHSPHLIENGLLGRPNSARKENISRTSSSTSLSQLPGYCSARSSPSLSPYAPIGTPLHPRNGALDEVSDRPSESSSARMNVAYPTNGGTFDGRTQEAKISEPGLGHCPALRLQGISEGTMPFDSTISSPVRHPVEGYPSHKTIKKPTSNMSGHQTTQSLNGIPHPASNVLNSIFDVGPEKTFPTLNCSTKPKRNSPGLNPSAKAFSFGGSKPGSVNLSCPPVSSVDRQRARGYSQSNVPSQSGVHKLIATNILRKDLESEDNSKNLLKTLHRSSCSAVLDFKGIFGSGDEEFHRGANEIFSNNNNNNRHHHHEKKKLIYSESRVHSIMISNGTLQNQNHNLNNRTGFLSELSKLGSSEEKLLPAIRSNLTQSGLFGSIGDMKKVKKIQNLNPSSSSFNLSPSLTSSILQQQQLFCSSPQLIDS